MRNPVFIIQSTLVLVVGAVGWVLGGEEAALAAIYGAGISLVQIGMLLMRAGRAMRVDAGARRMLSMAMWSFFERILLIAFLMFLGLTRLGLEPRALLLGLVIGQLGFLWAGSYYKLR